MDLDLATISTSDLQSLLGDINRELSKRRPKSKITLLKELCDREGWNSSYRFDKLPKVWVVTVTVRRRKKKLYIESVRYPRGDNAKKIAKEGAATKLWQSLTTGAPAKPSPIRGYGKFRNETEFHAVMAQAVAEGATMTGEYDHEDEYGIPIPPPKRTPEEDAALREALDLDLDEYATERDRILAESDPFNAGPETDDALPFDFKVEMRSKVVYTPPEVDEDEDSEDESQAQRDRKLIIAERERKRTTALRNLRALVPTHPLSENE